MNRYETLGQCLRRMRMERRWTLEYVASQIEYSVSAISAWENDDPVRQPTMDAMTVLEIFWQCDLTGRQLFHDDVRDAQKVLRMWSLNHEAMLRGLSTLGISPGAVAGLRGA